VSAVWMEGSAGDCRAYSCPQLPPTPRHACEGRHRTPHIRHACEGRHRTSLVAQDDAYLVGARLRAMLLLGATAFESKSFRLPSAAELLSLCVAKEKV